MTKKKDSSPKIQNADIRRAIEELSRDLRANKFVHGEMQFTDITNRDYFLKAFGDKIRFCLMWNKFLLWNGTCWEIDKKGKVEEDCVDFVHHMYRGLRVINDLQLQKDFEKHLIKSESFRRIQALVGLLKMSKDIKVSDDELDTDNYLFNVNGITLNLKNGKGFPPEPKNLITKKSKFVYDKEAKCPIWDLFLMQIFNQDKDLIRFVQKAMGYSLSGDVTEQCLFILWGTGANGKSTFLNVLQELFGDYACTTGTETFMKKTSAEWIKLLKEADVVCGVLNHMKDVSRDEQAIANSFIQQYNFKNKEGESCMMPCPPIRLGSQQPPIAVSAPLPGEDTREVLAKMGYSTEYIAEMLALGAVK